MLVVTAREPKAERIQGAWVSEAEVHRVVEFVRDQQNTKYKDAEVFEVAEKATEVNEQFEGEDPAIMRQAIELVVERGVDNMVVIDDSIVRGTTCRQIIDMARDAGAAQVYFASAAPPVRFPNVYGIDMPSASELIAHDRTVDEVCELIGADWLVFQDLDDLVRSSLDGNPDVESFDCSVFTGQYITGDIDQAYLDRIETLRNDAAQTQERTALQEEGAVVGIHNNA